VAQGPPTHRIVTKEIDWEVLFLALDQPKDVAKLLSLELSDSDRHPTHRSRNRKRS
jgi:hypothetical protein